MTLGTEGVEDGADQQGTEQALCHGAQRIDSVALQGDLNVLALHECFNFAHRIFLQK